MPTISAVPSTTRKPGSYTNLNTAGAKLGLPVVADKVLVLGQQTSAATATQAVPRQVFSAAEARTLFGTGSPCALMVQALLEQNPNIAEIWVCPLNEAGGAVAASATITVTASNLTSGTLTVMVGRHRVTVAVSAVDSQNTIAAAIQAAIAAATNLPFSASVGTNVVTLTARCKGPSGNSWVLDTDYTGTGLTCAIVQPASGATNPTFQPALDAVANTQFELIVTEFNDGTNLDTLTAHLDTVSGPMEQRPGIAFAGVVGSVSTATTLTTTRNHERLLVGYARGTRTHPMEIAAAFAAVFAAEPDLARPLNNVELTIVEVPESLADYLSRTEQETCLANGVAPVEVVNGAMRIVRTISTYVADSFGDDDDTLLDIQVMRVLDYTRFAVNTRLRARFSQVKIADVARTANTTDAAGIRSEILGVLLGLQNTLGYLERVEDHADRLIVERDGAIAGRVNARIPADVVDGLHVLASEIDFIYG